MRNRSTTYEAEPASGAPSPSSQATAPGDKLVGRGGQLLLLERPPFCPMRDCRKPCGPGPKCTCRICFCPDCRARRQRWSRPTPRLTVTPTPYAPPAPLQRTLFPVPPSAPRRRTP